MNILRKKIYLAGPDVFFPNSSKILEEKKQLCNKYGFIALSPLDNEVDLSQFTKSEAASLIASKNKELIEVCDIVIANLNGFRGFEPDSGTCFEVGYATALKKEIYVYLSSYDVPMRERYPLYYELKDTVFDKDMEGNTLEDFDMPINLMFSSSKILETFEDCLKDLTNIYS